MPPPWPGWPRLPELVDLDEVAGQGPGFPAEAYAPQACRRDAFRLPPPDGLPLVLGDERKHLQDKVGDERPQQVPVPPCVQQRHVQHKDVHAHFPGEDAPLLLYLFVIPAKPVDARDAEQVPGPEPRQERPVLRPLEVLAGQPVREDTLPGDAPLLQGQMLPVRVLVRAGDPDIAVGGVHGILLVQCCRRTAAVDGGPAASRGPQDGAGRTWQGLPGMTVCLRLYHAEKGKVAEPPQKDGGASAP